MTIDELRTKDLMEIKSMAYDCLARLENEQNNLNVLNKMIAEKSVVEKPVEEVK